MHNRLVIIGAGGHGKVVADIAMKLNKYEEIIFLDDHNVGKNCLGIPIVGRCEDVDRYICKYDFFVAIGNAAVRQQLSEQLEQKNAELAILIHPNAVLAQHITIGKGTVVMAGAVINPDSKIGKGCIINTCASVDHDCSVESYAHISVGAHLAGTVKIGTKTLIGAGATISNNVEIADECMIGAGAVVVKTIVEKGTYVGVPARKIK